MTDDRLRTVPSSFVRTSRACARLLVACALLTGSAACGEDDASELDENEQPVGGDQDGAAGDGSDGAENQDDGATDGSEGASDASTPGADGAGGSGDLDAGTESDAGADGELDAGGQDEGAAQVAEGRRLTLAVCGRCHTYANFKLNIVTADGQDLNELVIAERGEDMLRKLRDTERPMPPRNAPAELQIDDTQRAQIIAYIESVLSR